MVQQVAVINESTRLSDQEIATHISAVQEQMDRDVGPIWGFAVKLNQIPKGDPAPNDQWWMVYLDHTDQAFALGYHDLTPSNLPMGKVFVETTLSASQTVSRVLSHETAELLVDPWLKRVVQVDNRQYLVEVGDPLSMDSQGYLIGGVRVSGIALPGYYYETDNRYDLHGLLPGPIPTAIHGTFLMWFENNGWQWHMAATDPSQEENRKIEIFMRPRPGSRRYRRMIGKSKWVKSVINPYGQGTNSGQIGDSSSRTATRLSATSRMPAPAAPNIDEDQLEGCFVEVNESNATSDEELPAASGGVA